MRPASVHVQPTDFHGRDSQGKQEELHKKAHMETLRIIFNLCVLNTFHMECKIEAFFIIAIFFGEWGELQTPVFTDLPKNGCKNSSI